MRTLTLVVLMAGALCAADLDNNTVTVTATRTLDAQPDQAQIFVQLTAPRDFGLDDVLGKLKNAGVVAANLSSVSGVGANSEWDFVLTLPFPTLTTTLTNLAGLQHSLLPLVLTFSVIGTQVSTAPACPLPALVSDARKRADAMAAAAGMRTGSILSVSDQPAELAVPTALLRAGDFSASLLLGVIYDPATTYIAPQSPSCSLTVQFKLL